MAIIRNRRKSSASFLLDTYPSKSAYSLRQLKTGVNNVVRVRRSSDNAQQDFTPTQIIDGSLASFCVAGDGFGVIWYDQSGNDLNISQSDPSLQVQIVSSGTVITDGGKPAFDWGDLVNSKFFVNLSVDISHKSSFLVANYNGANPASLYAALTYNYGANQDLATMLLATSWWNSNPHGINGAALTTTSLPTVLDRSLIFDAVSVTPNRTQIYVGTDRSESNRGWIGKMQELIIYEADKTANRTAIESNINAYYGLY